MKNIKTILLNLLSQLLFGIEIKEKVSSELTTLPTFETTQPPVKISFEEWCKEFRVGSVYMMNVDWKEQHRINLQNN
jgi:hypothetical protein